MVVKARMLLLITGIGRRKYELLHLSNQAGFRDRGFPAGSDSSSRGSHAWFFMIASERSRQKRVPGSTASSPKWRETGRQYQWTYGLVSCPTVNGSG
jgi:hypothetical protein